MRGKFTLPLYRSDVFATRQTQARRVLGRHFPNAYTALSATTSIGRQFPRLNFPLKTQNSPLAMVRAFLTFYATEIKLMTSPM